MSIDETTTSRPIVSREIGLALGNATKLAISLGVTLAVAFAVRFWMPRFLGPSSFGVVLFAEEFAAVFFMLGTLGADTYIRTEVAKRPAHASEFFGSLTLVRLAISLGIAALMAATLWSMGKSPFEWKLVYVFAAGQVLFVLNTSLGSLLHARGTVGELAWVNALVKLVWGAGIVTGLLLGGGLVVVPVTFLVTEALKTPLLARAARKHLDLRWRVETKALSGIVIASVPYFLNYAAHRVYQKVDVSMISAMTTDAEVGWYGAAINVTFMIFLFMPIIEAVVLPMGSRLIRESEETLRETMAAAVRLVLTVTIPMALLLALNAKTIVGLLYSDDFGPTVWSLQILSPLVPLTYLCVLTSAQLVQLGRVWDLTKTSLIGLALNPLLNALVIVPTYRYLGDGGAGIAASITTVLTEVVVAALIFRSLGRAGLDRRLARLLLRLALACGIVALAHPWMAPLGDGRLLVEIVLYTTVGVAVGALPLRDLAAQVRATLSRRGRLAQAEYDVGTS